MLTIPGKRKLKPSAPPVAVKLAKVPYVGMTFNPFGTNSVGSILAVNSTTPEGAPIISASGDYKGSVTYAYDHDPERTFTEAYSDVQGFAHVAIPDYGRDSRKREQFV